jgi:glycosyltransferase involved in cell wall biosynthesis
VGVRVAVVIPCHNAGPYLKQAAGSALAQPAVSRIVIVDDNSSDDSRRIALSLAAADERVTVLAERNGRAAATRNSGLLAVATDAYDAILFLDADDVLGPDAVAALLDVLPPDGVAVGPWGRLEQVDGQWSATPATCRPRSSGPPLDDWLRGWYAPPCAVLWSRGVVERLGSWDERATVNDDGDLMMRALVDGVPLGETRRGGAFYRRLPEQTSLSGIRLRPDGLANRLYTLRKIHGRLEDVGRINTHALAMRQAYHLLAGDAMPVAPDVATAALDGARSLAGSPMRRLRRKLKNDEPAAPPASSQPPPNGHDCGLDVPTGDPRTASVIELARPKVTVVMPTYNRAHLLPRSIGSLLAQTFGDFELLVIDDGSTDDTADVLRSFGDDRIRHLRQPQNAGVAEARNRGLAEARGRFIAFLDSDDAWRPRKLALQVEQFNAKPAEVGIMQCGFVTHQPDGTVDTWLPRRRGDIRGDLLVSTQLHGSCVTLMLRRSVIAAAGIFDPTLPASEDWEYWIRASRASQVDYVAEVLADYYNDDTEERRSLGLAKNQRARAMIFARHRPALRRRGLAGRFWLETARRWLVTPSPDPAAARRCVWRAVREAPMDRTALGALRRQLLGRPLF